MDEADGATRGKYMEWAKGAAEESGEATFLGMF